MLLLVNLEKGKDNYIFMLSCSLNNVTSWNVISSSTLHFSSLFNRHRLIVPQVTIHRSAVIVGELNPQPAVSRLPKIWSVVVEPNISSCLLNHLKPVAPPPSKSLLVVAFSFVETVTGRSLHSHSAAGHRRVWRSRTGAESVFCLRATRPSRVSSSRVPSTELREPRSLVRAVTVFQAARVLLPPRAARPSQLPCQAVLYFGVTFGEFLLSFDWVWYPLIIYFVPNELSYGFKLIYVCSKNPI